MAFGFWHLVSLLVLVFVLGIGVVDGIGIGLCAAYRSWAWVSVIVFALVFDCSIVLGRHAASPKLY